MYRKNVDETYLHDPCEPEPSKKRWDNFKDTQLEVLSGSMQESKILDGFVIVFKLIAYLLVFAVVLSAATISKGTLLFMTSQIGQNVTKAYCNELIDRNKQFVVKLPQVERTAWIWVLIFTYFIPELLTFLRSIRICLFKRWKVPPSKEFWSLVATESLPAIGSALLVFAILPELDVVEGVMLTNAVCLVPAVVAFFSRTPGEKNNITNMSLDIISILAQGSALVIWPMVEKKPVMWLIPVALILISVSWWENFVSEGSSVPFIKVLGKEKKKIENNRYFLYIFVSIWKCILFFITTIIIISVKEESVDFMFDHFTEAFRNHAINVTEIKPLIGEYEGLFDIHNQKLIMSNGLTPIWVFLINASASYICYLFGKFACKILIQRFSYAFPINLTVPTTITILIAICGVHNGNPCAFNSTIPPYLFFNSPPFYFLKEFIGNKHVWLWLLWLLSQTWITFHIWSPRCENLARTEKLYVKPMFDAFLIDQSLALNRRRDDDLLQKDHDDDHQNDDFVMDEPIPRNKFYDCSVTRIYACATMWHESREEMVECLKSIFRLDEDQCARRLVKEELELPLRNYYELETHIFFDDAFVRKNVKDNNPKVNEHVIRLVEAVNEAAKKVHQVDIQLRPPTKYVTPYGGRLEWTLPGKNRLIAHLKDSKKIRQKKRWSQVMYMYYLLGYRLMERNDLSPGEKDTESENTYILALDGDVDFQPHAVHLLVELMRKNKDLGAACGRLHPLGSGPLVWYQMFEYAIGHWLQKATEHMIGCVLCSPGCFSLFRAKALMDNGVMRRYASDAKLAREIVQYDLGEDRWLCTLLLQNGYRIEYSAASDAFTHCPEGFKDFYIQRRRWMPSTTANIMDLLMNYKTTIIMNDNISRPYILYQIVLLIGTVLGPGTIFLMLVGAFVAVFQMDQWTSFLWNAVPILIIIAACILFKSDIQLLFAGIISAVYGLVMMAVLIGVLLQINADGILAPSSLFFFCFAGELIITALLHPKEVNCLLYGLVYYVTVPSMYMLLVIYSVFNLNNISWGTRELTVVSPDKEKEEKKKEEPKPKETGFSLIPNADKEENAGTLEFSVAGIFKCLLCTHSRKDEDNATLIQIGESLKALSAKLDVLERALHNKNDEHERFTIDSQLKPTILEDSKGRITPSLKKGDNSDNNSIISDSIEKEELYQWIDQEELGSGYCGPLDPRERLFFNDLIGKYLPSQIADKDPQVDKDLKDLRDKTVMAFFMINALFVLVVFLLTLKKDLLHVNWPFGAKYNFTYDNDRRDILLNTTPLQLEPIGFVFLIFFASLLIVQFIAMLFHRFSTFTQILSNTYINWRACAKANKAPLTEDEILANPVKVMKEFIKIKGADDEDEDKIEIEVVGRRKTVKQLAEQPHKRQSVNDLVQAFEKRTTRYLNNLNPQAASKKSIALAINNKRRSVQRRRSTQMLNLSGGYTNEGFSDS